MRLELLFIDLLDWTLSRTQLKDYLLIADSVENWEAVASDWDSTSLIMVSLIQHGSAQYLNSIEVLCIILQATGNSLNR